MAGGRGPACGLTCRELPGSAVWPKNELTSQVKKAVYEENQLITMLGKGNLRFKGLGSGEEGWK